MHRSLGASILVLGALLCPPPDARCETVRTIKTELSGADAAHFAVENLLGTMRISAGTGSSIEIIATVSAETADLADAVRLERVAGSGPATIRVRYPYDKVSTFKYREPSDHDGFIGWSNSDAFEYDGHRVRVNRGRGTALHADLDVKVPASAIQASFSNLIGLVDADGLAGQLKFRVTSADVRLRRLDGQVSLEGSSGDIRARDIKGSWTSDFSSGDCDIAGFEGDTLSFRTSSGDVVLRSVKARRAQFDSTSGDVRVTGADLQEFSVEATSGDITFEASGSSLREAQIRTSSGDVSLRLPADMPFDIDADQSSGDMNVRFSDGTELSHRDRVVGYRHGSGGARIRVRTSSGDLTVSPG
jgi:Putative adhesin